MEKRRGGRQLQVEDQDPESESYDWDGFAKYLVKATMDKAGVCYPDLSSRLEKLGVKIKPGALNRKINRGRFSAGFFLACLEALDVEAVEFEYECTGETVVRPTGTD